MALIIYSNGIVEEYVPLDEVFTEEELVKPFNEYPFLRSFRLPEVDNTWALWGEMDDPPENEFNKIASVMLEKEIYSPILFIHDSEISKKWKAREKKVKKTYKEFATELSKFVNDIVHMIAEEAQKEYEESDKSNMIFLTAVGHTKDKRVLFAFNPDEQEENFYINGGWNTFSEKIYAYIKDNFDKEPVEEGKPFVAYADNKTIVIVEDKHVDSVIDKLLKRFEKEEKYEECAVISDIKNSWKKTHDEITKIELEHPLTLKTDPSTNEAD